MRIGDVIKVQSCALAPPVSCRPVENRDVWTKPQRHSIQWYHPESPRKKKIKNSLSTDKCMITAFRDCGGVILVDAMPRGETINPDAYIRTLKELRKRFKPVRPHTNPTYILRQPVPTGGENEAGKKLPGPKYFAYFFFTFIRFAFAGRRGGAKKTSFTGDRTISWRLWLQHNAKQHSYLKTREAIMKSSWTVLALPPYSHDLTLSDSHLV